MLCQIGFDLDGREDMENGTSVNSLFRTSHDYIISAGRSDSRGAPTISALIGYSIIADRVFDEN